MVEGISYRQSQILEWFYKEPSLLLTVNEAQSRLAVSNQSARNDLSELLNMGYINLININKVTKGYVVGDNFEVLLSKMKQAIRRKNGSGRFIKGGQNDTNQATLF